MSGLAAYTAVQGRGTDDFVLRHAPLVKRIAYHLLNRLPPSVQLDDLIQAGMIGLLEAQRHYDPAQGASFETYAGIRIRGAMLDEIRRGDWTPRSVHRKTREAAQAIRAVENEFGREARDSEVAAAMGMKLEDYHELLQDASSTRVFSLDELIEGGQVEPDQVEGHRDGPFEGIQREAFRKALASAILGLPERERLVISLYYDDELNLKEIGQVLGVSESRVCQINSQAAARLRARLADWLGGGSPG
ncbi:MAG: RNA polymerase sigma factor FliA [Pseudomonadota bacterium]